MWGKGNWIGNTSSRLQSLLAVNMIIFVTLSWFLRQSSMFYFSFVFTPQLCKVIKCGKRSLEGGNTSSRLQSLLAVNMMIICYQRMERTIFSMSFSILKDLLCTYKWMPTPTSGGRSGSDKWKASGQYKELLSILNLSCRNFIIVINVEKEKKEKRAKS